MDMNDPRMQNLLDEATTIETKIRLAAPVPGNDSFQREINDLNEQAQVLLRKLRSLKSRIIISTMTNTKENLSGGENLDEGEDPSIQEWPGE